MRAKRIEQALDLRIRGFSYSKIAEAMKLGDGKTPLSGTSTAFDLVDDGLTSIPKESAEKTLEMELERCHKLLTGYVSKAVNGDDTKLRSAMLILDRLDKLRGIASPAQKLELTGANGGPIVTAEITDETRAKALAAFVAKFTARKQQGEK